LCGGPATSGQADPVCGPVLEVLVELFASASDGVDVQAGDEGNEGVAPMAEAFGFESRQPASLLLIES
jgi:hypothetical protein